MNDSEKIIEVINTLVRAQSRLFLCRHIDSELLDIPNSDIKEVSNGLLISFKLLCEDLHKELSKSIEILDTFD